VALRAFGGHLKGFRLFIPAFCLLLHLLFHDDGDVEGGEKTFLRSLLLPAKKKGRGKKRGWKGQGRDSSRKGFPLPLPLSRAGGKFRYVI
jgi:hypothetical protein